MTTRASSGAPTHGDESPLDQVTRDPNVKMHVASIVCTLASRFRLSNDICKSDLEQDCWTEICRAFQKYDPERASPRTFAKRVAETWRLGKARSLGNALKRRAVGIGDAEGIRAAGLDPADLAGLRLDLAELHQRVPGELLRIANELTDRPVTAVAETCEVHRGTVHRWLQGNRDAFPGFDPAQIEE